MNTGVAFDEHRNRAHRGEPAEGEEKRTALECMNSRLRGTPAKACIYEGVWENEGNSSVGAGANKYQGPQSPHIWSAEDGSRGPIVPTGGTRILGSLVRGETAGHRHHSDSCWKWKSGDFGSNITQIRYPSIPSNTDGPKEELPLPGGGGSDARL
ncbi:hypothetical protein ASPBRDRAFT_56439 [Aspergillus brasiliensis CBS 101740]|uniref:Uncharacterized protein n=1 Tax=Aspergillus brasiliensis (strain CBS 101740 / IMI 381727 / IBT 21946) TaxID=767769 RepID=A0A1L9UG68_ASPBC|nr:hypothetical protein ASPBRDRAFT_56439 [Aspergillus brasiliensis CBS 101740]